MKAGMKGGEPVLTKAKAVAFIYQWQLAVVAKEE